MENEHTEKCQVLLKTFFREHKLSEVNEMLNSIYQDWIIYSSVRAERGEKFKILVCFDDLKAFLKALDQLNQSIPPDLPGGRLNR